jgi:pilus assembly protein CpaE
MMNKKEQKTKIVIIDLDANSCKVLESIIQEIPNIEVLSETSDFAKGYNFIKETKPAIVLLNLYPSEEAVFSLAKKITKNYPDINLFITAKKADSKVVIKAMRAGAKEFLLQPVDKEEILNAINNAIMNFSQSIVSCKEGKIITLFGSKGGVGTTTTAVNVATSLAKYTQKDVVVVDMNLQFGNASLMLDIKAKYSILDLAKNIDNIDLQLLKAKLQKNSAGIALLPGPPQIEEAEAIRSEHIEQVLLLLKRIFDYVVIDTNHNFDDNTIKALDESDIILLISNLDVPTIYNTKRCLDVFQKIGYDKEKVFLVLNRYSTHDEIDLKSMEKLLDYPIFWRIPNQDFKTVITSINKGTPISQWMPNSKLSQNYLKMIKNFNGSIIAEEEKPEQQKKTFLKKLLT